MTFSHSISDHESGFSGLADIHHQNLRLANRTFNWSNVIKVYDAKVPKRANNRLYSHDRLDVISEIAARCPKETLTKNWWEAIYGQIRTLINVAGSEQFGPSSAHHGL
ncbi:MAG: hypothetical protein PVG19_06185 [Desulfobacterales bacterium]|jgi:hypothetical protein